MIFFGVSANSIRRSILRGNTYKLEIQTKALSQKNPDKLSKVVEKTLLSLQKDFSSSKIQSRTLTFLADLSQSQRLIQKIFEKESFSFEALKDALEHSLSSSAEERTLKLIQAFPSLIFEKVHRGRVFKLLSDAGKAHLVQSGVFNEKFLIDSLRKINNG